MGRHAIVGMFLILGLTVRIAGAQAPETGRAYKVAFWYELDRPTTSVKFRVYDLAKGEYDEKAVTRWLDTIFAKYPNHGAYVRDIQTKGEPGATEPERLAGALRREAQRWANLQRQPSKPIPRPIGPSIGDRTPPVGNPQGRPSPGSSPEISTPTPSPIPYPYRSRTP